MKLSRGEVTGLVAIAAVATLGFLVTRDYWLAVLPEPMRLQLALASFAVGAALFVWLRTPPKVEKPRRRRRLRDRYRAAPDDSDGD